MLAQVRALFDQQQVRLQRKEALVAEQAFKIMALTHDLAYYRRVRFGKASEALAGEQRMLFDETVDMDLAAIEEELEGQTAAKRQRKRAGRQALPPELSRIEHRHEPQSCQCRQCGADLVKIGEDVSEQLDVEPARFFVHRHIRPQYACRPCETVTAAPIPPAVIDGGLAAVGLLAWAAACKYLDHLPLYRIEQIAARQGVPLARSTLGEWILSRWHPSYDTAAGSTDPRPHRNQATERACRQLHGDMPIESGRSNSPESGIEPSTSKRGMAQNRNKVAPVPKWM